MGKAWIPLSSPPSYGLISTTTVFTEGWLWYEITQEGWYAIKTKNPNQTIQEYNLTIRLFSVLSWTLAGRGIQFAYKSYDIYV